MSRETDTPSSGPNGHGGAAYPSGTPPYGTPMASDSGADAGRSAAQPEERKTETTLTTRIRINIPGSRPIPPVVVRQPVADAESSGSGGGADTEPPTPSAATSMSTGTVEPPAEPGAQAGEKTSDWFAPRKSGAPKGGPGGPPSNGAGLPGGSGPGASGTGAGGPGGASAGAGRSGAGAGRPGGVVGSMSVPGGSRPGGTNGAGLPGATGGPVAPGHGGGTGSFDVTEALAAGPLGNGNGARPGDEARRDDLPYFSENGNGGQNGQGGPNGYGPQGGPGGPGGYGAQGGPGGFDPSADFNAPNDFDDFGAPNGLDDFGGPSDFNGSNGRGGQGGPQGPAGPTTGPVTGDGPVVPPAAGARQGAPGGPGGPRGSGAPGRPGGPVGSGISAGPGGPGGPGASGISAGPSRPGGPGGPGGPPGPSGPGAPVGPGISAGPGGPAGPGASPHVPGRGPGGGLSDDTAILTPQKPAPEPGNPHYGGVADNVSGHTVTSGIPVVPSGAQSGPFGPGGTEPSGPHTPPKLPETGSSDNQTSRAPKKKGRNKLALVGGGVIVLAGGVYGAGLLMAHSDVPKGTTVLGVDIGGGTRDDAVKKLNDSFDERVNKPLKLSVGGKTVTLEPDKAGLQFDMQQTVSAAASSDYNPVSVIGSLFGNHRVVDPVMPTDEEKLHAALEDASGGSGSVTDGTIKFESGKAVAVYGKAGKGIDVAKSTEAVEAAYRTQVETGATGAVNVPTTTQQPTVSNAEVDRMMKEFAEPAMSAKVTVQAAGASPVLMSPEKSLWKFLQVKAVNGKLVDAPDLAALKELYGGAFDGVLITRANGKKTPVTPQDVYVALREALKSKTDRVAVIETNPS
ncbi:hypothetical protein [Streptomyces viridochromogenes]|uniref:hypothetical protein n=1 Tax=Streptomyces viridochromogenes TaxID=1938 RepID=UPI00069F5B51|nr:membrane protein [Streptomyces viridochromogenes]KOG08705.1 membrane protein [Streptomyces viridochromogenes]